MYHLLALKAAEEIPDHDIGVDCVRSVAERGHRCGRARPDMATIADRIVLDDGPIRALGPLDSGYVGLLKDGLADAGIALVDSKPEIEKSLHRKLGRRAVIGRELISLPVDLQHWDSARGLAAIGWNVIEGSLDGRQGRDLIAHLAGHAISHAGPDRVTGDIDALGRDTIILLHIAK